MGILELKKKLDTEFGPDWPTYELETLLYDEQDITSLLVDQISVLKVLLLQPALFWENPLFFLYSIPVFNGESTDFSHIPNPDSYDMAKAIIEADKITGFHPASTGVKLCVLRALENDGYSETLYPFTLISKSFPLAPGQLPEDTEAKKQALATLS